MGQNLALNISDRGYRVAVYNRTGARTRRFLDGPAAGSQVAGAETLEELTGMLTPPRRVMLMVKAGRAVDETIAALLPLLEAGDIIIDGGNSYFMDTIRRTREMSERGILFVGAGVSGGEEGARRGPSVMPGGDERAWPWVREILQAAAAKTSDGTPCCDWVGADGAGHYVKMAHNGIEYGDMQVIAEAYHIMGAGLGMSNREMAEVFREWNGGALDSFLIGITADILDFTDSDGEATLDAILDAAGQKGTGKWTAVSSLELGQPVTLVAEAVYARIVSSLREERQEAARVLGEREAGRGGAGRDLAPAVRDALYASKIVSYAQGFMLLRGGGRQNTGGSWITGASPGCGGKGASSGPLS